MQPCKVICFYTPNTPYEQEVIHLKASCEKFGIPFEIDPVESKGSWQANIAMKPAFILEKIEKADGPILWVDADGAFLQKPDFAFFEPADVSVRFMQIHQGKREHAINAATIYISNTQTSKNLVRKWVARCSELGPVEFVDQIALYDVLLENREARVMPLPVSYCKIFDVDTFFINDEDVVIEQRQASRLHKCAF